jgi:hypothetical protein
MEKNDPEVLRAENDWLMAELEKLKQRRNRTDAGGCTIRPEPGEGQTKK